MAELSIKTIEVWSFWYSKIVLRFFKDNENTLCRNPEICTLKLENNKSRLMFNETCDNSDILSTYTNIEFHAYMRYTKVHESD